jgi:hypothetical protein
LPNGLLYVRVEFYGIHIETPCTLFSCTNMSVVIH